MDKQEILNEIRLLEKVLKIHAKHPIINNISTPFSTGFQS